MMWLSVIGGVLSVLCFMALAAFLMPTVKIKNRFAVCRLLAQVCKKTFFKAAFLTVMLATVQFACKPLASKDSKSFSADRIISGALIKQALEVQLDSIKISGEPITSCKNLQSQALVIEFYKQAGNAPVWINQKGISALGDTLIIVLKQSYEDGLDPKQYHSEDIGALRSKDSKYKKDTIIYKDLAHLDILLTDAFFTYATQQYAGCIHTSTHNVEWEEHIKDISPIDSLQKALKTGQIRATLARFVCNQQQYVALKKALSRYLEMKHNNDVMMQKHIEVYAAGKGPLGAIIYRQLELIQSISDSNKKDNQPGSGNIDERIEQLDLNMERWRWMPHIMPQPYVMVNIAGFKLMVADSGKTVLSMKIVVGKKYRQTPLFKADITYITLNPTWEVPERIAREEVLPAIKRNGNYLAKNRMKVYSGWGRDAHEVSPASVDWSTVSASNLRYHFSQTPGPWNALGRISFTFPNKYYVYLHDTPNKNLFLQPVRAFSHGCIRIEKPIELAVFLLKNKPGWTKEHILNVIASGAELTRVTLNSPVDIYICYWTCWANENGEVVFAPDIYGYDKALFNSLHSCLHL